MITDDFGDLVGPAHIKTIYARLDHVDERMDTGDSRMGSIETELAKNTAATARVEAGTEELLGILNAMKGGLKVLEGLGKLAKPVTALVALGLALWSAYLAFRNGGIGPR